MGKWGEISPDPGKNASKIIEKISPTREKNQENANFSTKESLAGIFDLIFEIYDLKNEG